MKLFKIVLIGFILLLCPALSVAQNSVYDKYSEMKNVSSVYISKTMLELDPNLYRKDVNIGKVAGQLEAVYIISTMNADIKKTMRTDIEDFVKKGKYEILMKQKGMVSGSSFYIKKKGDKIKELVMVTDGAAKLSFIQLVGELTLQDIQRITNYSQSTGFNLMPAEDLKEYLGQFKNIGIVDLKDLNIDWSNIKKEFKRSMKEINNEGLKELRNLKIDLSCIENIQL